jgi:hypothetical protein
MRQSVAAIALIRREAEGETSWLAQWNDGWQAFSFVGGHKRHNESFRECMIREISEELGLREGVDVLISSAPFHHLEYTDVSRHTDEQTDYIIELFDVALIGSNAAGIIVANRANRWLSEPARPSGSMDRHRAPVELLERVGHLLHATSFIEDPAEENYHRSPSPDGQWILFGSDRSGVMQLYVARANGTDARPITSVSEGFCAMHGHWQPINR